MPTLPQEFHTGKHVTVFGLTPQTVGNDGVTLTAGTTQSYLGVWESMGVRYSVRGENIKPAGTGIENFVPISDDFELTLVEIIKGNGASIGETRYLAFDYFTLIVQSAAGPNGGGTAGPAITYLAVRAGFDKTLGEGKANGTLNLRCCGVAPTVA